MYIENIPNLGKFSSVYHVVLVFNASFEKSSNMTVPLKAFRSFRSNLAPYGVHLRTKIIENKRQFEVQKLDYPCRNLVI